jgi:hypothetical protein
MRKMRREFSRQLKAENASYVLDVARLISETGQYLWIAYELIHDHPIVFHALNRKKL